MTSSDVIARIADRPLYPWTRRRPTGLRYHDFFCGAGGSSLGMTGAGHELAMALNHWERAIETHAANFRDAEHACVDVTHYDLRRMPKAEILWASPICTEASPAGGNASQSAQEELELFGPVAKEGMERTRATFWEVIRSTELHGYEAVIVENVVDVATKWRLFDYWISGMEVLGYTVQFVSVSSAHVGGPDNPWAPQWRDRLYMVFTRKGAPLPDVEPRPLAHCFTCAEDVHAVQSWKKPGRKIGKYRQQYTYVCPRTACRHAQVEPYVLPAAAAIDWSDLGTRIGDRKRRLAAKTYARIEAGLALYAQPITAEVAGNTFERRPGVRTWPAFDAPLTTQTTTSTKGIAVPPVMVAVNHDGDGRAYPAYSAPLASRTTKIGEGVAQVPDGAFVDVARTNNTPSGVGEPLAPVTTGRNHALVVPAGGTWRDGAQPASVPMGARTTRDTDALVCPPLLTELRRNGEARPADDEPTSTIAAGGNHHGIVSPPEPFYVRNFGGNARPQDMVHGMGEPLGALTARDHTGMVVPPGSFVMKYYTPRGRDEQMVKDPTREPLGALTAAPGMGLVIPFRRGARPYGAGEAPLSTVATREHHGLAHLGVDVEDCLFRMLTPEEHLRAQRFHAEYVVLGNKGERTMQAGNAVSSNVAQWLGSAVAVALCGEG